MPKENNKMQVDIDTLKKQNVNDLLSIKELYKRIEELGEKTSQIKYIDNTIVKKIKKEYEKLKKIILDENVQIKLNKDIETINLQQIKLNKDIETFNIQMDTIDSKKATKVEVDLERERINNLINISSGEVDSVEISDARIGANGVVYDNLGNTIRMQLNEKIDGDISNSKFYWEAGAYSGTGKKIGYANETHTRTITFLPQRLKGISNNSGKKFDLLVYDNTGTFEKVVSVGNGTKVTFEDNKLYNIHIAVPFTEISTIINSIIFESKPNKYDKLILEESNKTKKEIGIPVDCNETSYTKISIKSDGTSKSYDGWYTSDFRNCSGYKYLVCEDVAFFKSVVLNAISFYDSNKNYIGGIYHPNIIGESGNGYSMFTGSVKIPSNAYYFRDGKYKYNNIESKNLISLCDVELPITKIKSVITSINKEIEDLKNEKDEKINIGKILCIGDSLTQGDYGSNPAGTINIKSENYPFYLNKYLNKFVTTNVINAGRCGFTSTTYWENKVKTIDFTNVKTIVIMLGTNGYLTDTIESDTKITDGQSYENYANTHTGNYCKIIEYCFEKTSNLAQIILITPPKTSQRDVTKMKTLVEVIKKIGKKYSLKVLDGYNEFGISPSNFNTMLPIDGLHGGKLAYKKIASFIGSNIISNLSYEIDD